MPVLTRRLGNPDAEAIVCVPGFGDNGSMYAPLADTALGRSRGLVVVDLPGFGAAPPDGLPADLERSGELVAEVVERFDARVVVGHSLGSIVASLAALAATPRVHTVISLEGNLTPADAYFSGSAASYGDPVEFRAAFLARLDDMAAGSDVVARYREQVALADPRALWHLGCDANGFSASTSPGRLLMQAAPRVHYVYNPDNTPPETIAWLEGHELASTRLAGASHWVSVDEPARLSEVILDVLGG